VTRTGPWFHTAGRMCPPPRSLATEAHGCFMVWIPDGSYRIQGRGAMFARTGGLPSVVVQLHPRHEFTAPDDDICHANEPRNCPPNISRLRPIAQTALAARGHCNSLVTEDRAMLRGRKPEGEYALSNAERQARHRARLQALQPRVVVKHHKPVDRRSRPKRWDDALAEMLAVQAECAAWFDALPESLRDSATGISLQAIIDLDLDALAEIEPPRGYGRD